MTTQPQACFYVLGKPLSIIDAINRQAAAQGSVRYAMATADADYNGHALALYWNDYRGYYVLDYHWGERVVLHRGTDFARALAVAKQELARQGRGATLRINALYRDAHIARRDPDTLEGSLQDHKDERPDAWKFKRLWDAKMFSRQHMLVKAESEAEYLAAVEKQRAARVS